MTDDDARRFLASLEIEGQRRLVELLERAEIRRQVRESGYLTGTTFYVGTPEEDAEDAELLELYAFPPTNWWR